MHDVSIADLLAHERPFEIDFIPSRPAIWPDILLSNRDALVAQIDETVRRLGEARDAIATGDTTAVARWQREAGAEDDGEA